MDPDYKSHKRLTSPEEMDAKNFRLTDLTPEGILKTFWGPHFTAHLTITEYEDEYIEWVLRAPMNMTQTTRWSVGEEKLGLVLVEETFFEGNRMSLRAIKKHHARTWRKMHQRWQEQFEIFLEQEKIWDEAKEHSREAKTGLDYSS